MVTSEMSLAIPDTKTRRQFFEDMYERAFPSVARFVSQQGGSFEDAKDIFQDALVIFHEKMMESQLHVTLSYEAYLTGIAKHLWIRKFKDDVKKIALDDIELTIAIPENYGEQTENNRLLLLLELAGKKCVELLHAFYYEKLPLRAISTTFGFSGIRSATVQKFKCIEKMRNIIKEKSIGYDDLSA